MILITGATGTIGSEVIKHLIGTNTNTPLRALVRNVKKASGLQERGVEIVQGDFLDRDSLKVALQGVEKAFLVTANAPRQVEMESNFVDAAQRADVRHIVKVSVLGADPKSSSTAWRKYTYR